MVDGTVRGHMIHSADTFIKKAYDRRSRTRSWRRSIRASARCSARSTARKFPVQDHVSIIRAIAAHHQETDGKIRETLLSIGRWTAEGAMGTTLPALPEDPHALAAVREAAEALGARLSLGKSRPPASEARCRSSCRGRRGSTTSARPHRASSCSCSRPSVAGKSALSTSGARRIRGPKR